VDVQAGQLDTPIRANLELALVIDRSGSMAGKKLAAAKGAARTMIDRLDGNDRVTLISYGSTVSLLARGVPGTAAGKQELLRAVDEIEDFGGTYISGALNAAAAAISRAQGSGRLQRIILLSDGEANEGITSSSGLIAHARTLAQTGITISSIGFGTEFNEDLMLGIADASGGRYTYARAPSDLSSALTREFNSAEATLGRDLVLTLDPAPGVRIEKIFGYNAKVGADGRQTIRLRDIEAGGHIGLVAKLSQSVEHLGPTPMVHLALAGRPATAAIAESMPLIAEELHLGMIVTSDSQQVRRGLDRVATSAGVRAQAADNLEQASRTFAQGLGGEASRRLQAQTSALLQKNLTELGDKGLEAELLELRGFKRFEDTEASSAAGLDLVKTSKAKAMEWSR